MTRTQKKRTRLNIDFCDILPPKFKTKLDGVYAPADYTSAKKFVGMVIGGCSWKVFYG
jgi:hypothetical protein